LILKYLKHFVLNSTSWALNSSDDILVGGQAVIEGVMMRSPKGYCVAVRRQDGTVKIIKNILKTAGEKRRIFKLPIFRGVGVLGQALVLGIKALRFSAEEAMQDMEPKKKPNGEQLPALVKAGSREAAGRFVQDNQFLDQHHPGASRHSSSNEEGSLNPKVSSWMIAGNLVLALGINILLFVVLPLFITRYIQGQVGFESSLLFNGVDGVFRVLVFLGFLGSVSMMKDMRRVFQYHGAEHKTVYNFEARQELRVENAKRFSTLHPRCGTSFLLVVMIVSIAVFSIAHFDTITGKLLSRILLLPLIAGISYEVIRYAAKHPKSIMRFVTMPGLLLQKITTKEPDDTQIEVAIRALDEALTV